MAEQTTTNYGFSYYDQYDINWHTGINNNFINLDSLLNNIEGDVKGIGGLNFIPHTLWQQDSNSDGIPDLWSITSGSSYITGKQLQTSDVMGFAKKLVLSLNNSSGVTQYGIIECQGITPPNTDIVFSAYLTSAILKVKLRIYDGANNDGAYATYITATRVEKSHILAATVSNINLGIVIEIPTGTVNETVEIQLPMLNVGDKASAFCPAPGEMAQLLTNDLYVFGQLKTNLDCNQRQLQQLRLQLRTADPTSPVRGEIWFDDASGKKRLRFYDGTANEDLSVAKQIHGWVVAGALSVAAELGGVWLVPRSLTIEKAYIYCKTTGSAGSTIVDINKNGSTIFSTQGNRPSLAFDDTDKKAVSGTPEITGLAEGDIVSLDIDQPATGAADLTVILICR